ncbi:MAG TPA: hypothetical protein VK907_03620, partial [Phnomibacter sp.]|nr:hypothetical protein [Phnomibacter sp.]
MNSIKPIEEKGRVDRSLYLMWSVAFILLLIVAWPARFYFLNDDLVHIPLAGANELGHHNSVRYVGDLSLLLDHWLYGKWAPGYHITNLLLHAANAWLLVLILRVSASLKHPWLLFYSTILFTFYGSHSEAVFWIIGRSATLGFFWLALSYFLWIKRNSGLFFISTSAICWALALLSYESVWSIPFWFTIIWSYQRHKGQAASRVDTLCFWLCWAIFILYLFLRKGVTGAWLGSYEGAAFEHLQVGVLAGNYARLVLRTIVPPLYDPTIFFSMATILLALLAWMCFSVIRYGKATAIWYYLVAGWLLSYLPYLSLGISRSSAESERYLYLPSAFFSVLVVYSLYTLWFPLKKRSFFGVCSLLFIFHCSWMANAANEYSSCGRLVKETFSALKGQQPISDITFSPLPATVHGIPTLRSGSMEGYKWLIDPTAMPRVVVRDT